MDNFFAKFIGNIIAVLFVVAMVLGVFYLLANYTLITVGVIAVLVLALLLTFSDNN